MQQDNTSENDVLNSSDNYFDYNADDSQVNSNCLLQHNISTSSMRDGDDDDDDDDDDSEVKFETQTSADTVAVGSVAESEEEFTVEAMAQSEPRLISQSVVADDAVAKSKLVYNTNSDIDDDQEGVADHIERWFSTSTWHGSEDGKSEGKQQAKSAQLSADGSVDSSDMLFQMSMPAADEDCLTQRESLYEIVHDAGRNREIEQQSREERRSVVNYRPPALRNTITTRESLLGSGVGDDEDEAEERDFDITSLQDMKLTDEELAAVGASDGSGELAPELEAVLESENDGDEESCLTDVTAPVDEGHAGESSFATHHSTSLPSTVVGALRASMASGQAQIREHKEWCALSAAGIRRAEEAAVPAPKYAPGYGYIPTATPPQQQTSGGHKPGIILLPEELVSCSVELEHIPGQVRGVGQAVRHTLFAFRLPLFPAPKAGASRSNIHVCTCNSGRPTASPRPSSATADGSAATFQCALSPTCTATMCYTSTLLSLVDWYSVFPEREYARRDGTGGFHNSLPMNYERSSTLEQMRLELNYCYKHVLLLAHRNQTVQTVLLELLMAPFELPKGPGRSSRSAKPPGWLITSLLKPLPTHVVTSILPSGSRSIAVVTHSLDFSTRGNAYLGNYTSLASSHLRSGIKPPAPPGMEGAAANTLNNLQANRVVASPYIYESPCIIQVSNHCFTEEYLLVTIEDIIFMKSKDSNNHQIVKYKHHANDFTAIADAHVHASEAVGQGGGFNVGGSISPGRDSGGSASQGATVQPKRGKGKNTTGYYRVPLEDILEIVPLDISGDGQHRQNTKICGLNIYHVLHHFNIVTLAKVYHVAVRGKVVRDHWLKTLSVLCAKRQELLANSGSGSGRGAGSASTSGGNRYSINEYTAREQLVSIPHGWFRYHKWSSNLYSDNIATRRGASSTSSNLAADKSKLNADKSKLNTTSASADLLMWSDATVPDSNASSNRIVLNHRSFYGGVNFSRPLLMQQGLSDASTTTATSTSTTSVPRTNTNPGFSNISLDYETNSTAPPTAPSVAVMGPRNLIEYVEAILQLLFDILESTRVDATAAVRQRQKERDRDKVRNTFVTPGVYISDDGRSYSVDAFAARETMGDSRKCEKCDGNNTGTGAGARARGQVVDVGPTSTAAAAAKVNKLYNIYFSGSNGGSATGTAAISSTTAASKAASTKAYHKPLSVVDRMWVIFLDAVASLQNIDLLANVQPNSLELVCIWVNLFHIMQMHSVLVLGPPRGTLAWISQFRTVSYEAFGDIFSLCEMEHNIIAAGHCWPKAGLIADLFLFPRFRYPFALNTNDIRLHFILNRGAVDQLKAVPIYKPDQLAAQCDITISTSLPLQVAISSSDSNGGNAESYTVGGQFLQESECSENPYTEYMDNDGSMINNPKKPCSSSASGGAVTGGAVTGGGSSLAKSGSKKKSSVSGGLGQRLSSMFGLSGGSGTAHYTITLPWCTQWHAEDFMQPMLTPESLGLTNVLGGGDANSDNDRQRITKLLLLQKAELDPHLRSRSHMVGLEYSMSKYGENFASIKSHRTRRILSILQQLLPYTHGYVEETFQAIVHQGHLSNVTIRYTRRSFDKELFYQMCEITPSELLVSEVGMVTL